MRVVTLNLWGTHPPLEERLNAVVRGLTELAPDVVLLQEVRVGDGLANTAGRIAEQLGLHWVYACATAGGAGAFGPGSRAGEEGLAILSSYPLHDVRHVPLPEPRPDSCRILLSAGITVGIERVWVHTTHLHWRLGDGLAREAQVVAIHAAARACGDGLHVLGGDFNTAPEHDEIRYLVGQHTLAGQRAVWQDAFARIHPGERGDTWCRRNPMTDELGQLPRDRRIDYIFVSPEERRGRGRILDARVVLDAPDAMGIWPSDHFGVLADITV